MNKITLTQTYKVELPFYREDFETEEEWKGFLESVKDQKYRQELLDDNVTKDMFEPVGDVTIPITDFII